MRILMTLPDLDAAGGPRAEVTLARALRRAGHATAVFAPAAPAGPGRSAGRLLAEAGVGLIEAPGPGLGARAWTSALESAVRGTGAEVVLTVGVPASLRAALLGRRLPPQVAAVLPGDPWHVLPAHLPLVVDTPGRLGPLLAAGRTAYLLAPAIDPVPARAAHRADHRADRRVAARRALGVPARALVIGTVTALAADEERAQGVLEAIRAVDRIASGCHAVLLVVGGDGGARTAVAARAAAVNARHGRDVVRLVGAQPDPGRLWAASDIGFGTGPQLLAGMAWGLPVVVHGEGGFWRVVDEDSAGGFVHSGWFGSEGAGLPDLVSALDRLREPSERARLGDLSRRVVEERYGVEDAARLLVSICSDVCDRPAPRREQLRARAVAAVAGARHGIALRLAAPAARETLIRTGGAP